MIPEGQLTVLPDAEALAERSAAFESNGRRTRPRRLAGILAADVVGYSALMEADA
jgi:class 3 adenylate cyclase